MQHGAPATGLGRLLPALLPAVLFLLALTLPSQMFQSDQIAARVGLGPEIWPKTALGGLAVLSAVWFLRELWVLARAGRCSMLNPPAEDGHYHFGKAVAGLAMIVAYGWLLPQVGFAMATAGFIVLWCLIGGLRNPVVVLPVALIGTLALLWLFMGLALMPLPRGHGVFDTFSVWLLKAVAIY